MIVVEEVEKAEYIFMVRMDGIHYTQLAKIRNAFYENDIDALNSVIQRGLIELEGDKK
jgi:hypothetical protein